MDAQHEGGFTFVDLFAGIGGFHAALHGLGGRCVYAAELDPHARATYRRAWIDHLPEHERFRLAIDINDDAPLLEQGATDDQAGDAVNVPDHDVLAAGFPCQAFSKSGKQMGVLDTVRGTLFYNVLRIVKAKQPKIVILENVRNLVGPRHRETTFATIITSLRGFGYEVSDVPTLVSPHRINPAQGGTPQVRDRVYIVAIRSDLLSQRGAVDFVGVDYGGWDPRKWRIDRTPLPICGGSTAVDASADVPARYRIAKNSDENRWLAAYDTFLRDVMRSNGLIPGDGRRRLPGFPLWFRHQTLPQPDYDAEVASARDAGYDWKVDFLEKNRAFYAAHQKCVDKLRDRSHGFPESRQKLEWQNGSESSVWDGLIQLRPSGIRVRPLTYAPALVAINQAPIYGPRRRRITPSEAARLQAMPENVIAALTAQDDSHSYRQLGNAVHVGAVQLVLTQFLEHHAPRLTRGTGREPAIQALLSGARQSLASRATLAKEPDFRDAVTVYPPVEAPMPVPV